MKSKSLLSSKSQSLYEVEPFSVPSSRVSLFGKLTDLQVCGIIDNYAHPKTYTQITYDERLALCAILREKGVDTFQIERCM